MKRLIIPILMITTSASAQQLPQGVWPLEKSAPIIEKTATTRLAPDLSGLTAGERGAVEDLLKVGAIMQDLYEISRHRQALSARSNLEGLHQSLGSPQVTQNLLDLYRYNQGPIAVTLDNKREPFVPVDAQVPGRNVYPWGITKAEVDKFLAANPSLRDEILGERTVVRRATLDSLKADMQALSRHQAINVLHPTVGASLLTLSRATDSLRLYAVPYAVAYAAELSQAHLLLRSAADKVEADDPEFARYLRNRGRDLITNDYESGDASWVTGRFKRLNAQIGSYETYDDALYGAKAFHSLSLLLRDEKATAELTAAISGLQDVENALPYDAKKRVREDIPVGIYDVIADFGQSRGGNTATILPNDALFSRRYGRTILLRRNIMTNPEIFGVADATWKAVMSPANANDLKSEGDFYRTLWHEIGHYLGVDRDKNGRDLAIALEDYADSIEEMKADLVSLFAAPMLRSKGHFTDERLAAVYAAGIRRTLQNVKPREDQPYQRMMLVQFNYYLEKGLIEFDRRSGTLKINYEKYPETITSLLREVLALQHNGDVKAAAAFYAKYSDWTPQLHEALAAKMRSAGGPRFRIFRYAALGE